MVETHFSQHAYFAGFLKEIKLHAFHNPNYTTRGGFGHDPDCSHPRNEHMEPPAGRRNLLYESSPAGTMVDGSPRAASLFSMSFGVFKVRHGEMIFGVELRIFS